MTPSTKPTTRVTPSRDAGRYIVVTIIGDLIGFRLKGTRKIYWLTVSGAYASAVKAEAAAKKWEKQKAREAKYGKKVTRRR